MTEKAAEVSHTNIYIYIYVYVQIVQDLRLQFTRSVVLNVYLLHSLLCVSVPQIFFPN
jgi:hypothetical protein